MNAKTKKTKLSASGFANVAVATRQEAEEARGSLRLSWAKVMVLVATQITIGTAEALGRQAKFAESFDQPTKFEPLPEGYDKDNPTVWAVGQAEKLLRTMPRQQAGSMDTGLLTESQWNYLANLDNNKQFDAEALFVKNERGSIDEWLGKIKPICPVKPEMPLNRQ